MRSQRIRVGFLTGMLVCGCVAEAVHLLDGESVQQIAARQPDISFAPDVTVLASLRTDAGSRLEFYRTTDGDVGLVTVGRLSPTDAPLQRALRSTRNFTALYESLSGRAAPEALRRAVSTPDRVADRSSDTGERQGAGGNLSSNVTPAAVSADFCNLNLKAIPDIDFAYCWKNLNGTPWVKKKVDHMSCRWDVVSGSLVAKYRYKKAGNWHTKASMTVTGGYYLAVQGYYLHYPRWRHCTTTNNGAQLHFRAAGHNNLIGLPPVFFWP